jgi:hypothetical protein
MGILFAQQGIFRPAVAGSCAILASGGRYPLPAPDFHRPDRASFAWRPVQFASKGAANPAKLLISRPVSLIRPVDSRYDLGNPG